MALKGEEGLTEGSEGRDKNGTERGKESLRKNTKKE